MDTSCTSTAPGKTCEELLPQHRCGACAEWSRCTDARMANHGECEYRGPGHYSHEQSACLTTPSRWRAGKIK